jgi:anaerobic magnesium-protoporphyrin IX monomethyl ester cyclase
MACTDVILMYPPTSLKKGWTHLPFPMNMVCLGSYLKQNGVSVRIIHDKQFQLNEFTKIIKEENPRILGLSCDCFNSESCFQLAKLTKLISKECLVVLGGTHATLFPNLILEKIPAVDIVVRGEGEQPLLEMINYLRTKGELGSVSGISYRNNGKIIVNKDRPVTESPSSFLSLSYDLLDMKQILSEGCSDQLPIHTGRGCGFLCKFCTDANQMETWYRRDASSIIAEIQRCIKDYGVQGFLFLENTFTGDKRRVRELCEQIGRVGLKIRWTCVTHLNCVDNELLISMKAAGCQKIVYGVDSLSEDILKKMKKGNGVQKAMQVLRQTYQLGIETEYMIILGYPGETEETLLETERNVMDLGNNIFCRGVNMFQLFPGSPIYNVMKNKGFVKDEMWFSGEDCINFTKRYYLPSFLRKIHGCKQRLDLFFEKQRQKMNPADLI